MFADELALVLPRLDSNGDAIKLIVRERFWDEVWPLIVPVKHMNRFRVYQRVSPADPHMDPDLETQVSSGIVQVVADVNTPEGRKVFLDAWWPKTADGTCIIWTAPVGKEAGLPYPTNTNMRCAAVVIRIPDPPDPNAGFGTFPPPPKVQVSPIRFGTFPVTTTHFKAQWDVGIRQVTWYTGPNGTKWLQDNGLMVRLTPVPAGNPLRAWPFPGAPDAEHAWTFTVDLSKKPVTNDFKAWLAGTP